MKKELLIEESKSINKFVKKFGVIKVNDTNLNGELKITRCRKYSNDIEFDIEFKGMVNFWSTKNWCPSDSIHKLGFTVHYINKIMRRHSFKSVKQRMRYFGVEVTWCTEIKKIKLT